MTEDIEMENEINKKPKFKRRNYKEMMGENSFEELSKRIGKLFISKNKRMKISFEDKGTNTNEFLNKDNLNLGKENNSTFNNSKYKINKIEFFDMKEEAERVSKYYKEKNALLMKAMFGQ